MCLFTIGAGTCADFLGAWATAARIIMFGSHRFGTHGAGHSSHFRLVDLLVLILAAGLLIALLLPAIDAEHATSRRNQCLNNLKQLALAAQNHNATKKFLPTGGWGHDWIGDPDAGLGESQPGGWAYSIMFFMEERNQAPQISGQPWMRKVAMEARPNAGEYSHVLHATFYCPERRAPGLYPGCTPSVNSKPFLPPNLVAKTDYAANGGTVGFLREARQGDNGPNDISTTHGFGESEEDAVAALPTINHTWYITPPVTSGAEAQQPSITDTTFTGVCWYRSQVSFAMIPDGTSNVYLFGEKYMDHRSYETGGPGSGDEESVYRGMASSNIRLTASGGIDSPSVAPSQSDDPGLSPVDPNGAFLYPPLQDRSVWPGDAPARPPGEAVDWFNSVRFGSAHAESFNMAFCDGSVHSISYDIDPRVHAMLGDRRDGNAVDPTAGFEH
jgi:prepilin-type processing-associated H-X9-DG protein